MIDIHQLHVRFNIGTPLESHAVRGATLTIPKKQFITVIGSNGAGKSTILNAVAGVAPAISGKITVDQEDMTDWPVHRRASVVSRVFQDPRLGTCEDLSLLENFAIAQGRTEPRGFLPAITPTMKEDLCSRLSLLGLGLENRVSDLAGQLSGGQRQALSLIMATTGHSKVLLLDEHTAALDPKTAAYVMSLTSDLVEETEMTTLMVTHSMQQALDYGERTIMLHRGKVVFDIAGAERSELGVKDLLDLFKKFAGEELSDDALLLG